jgi:hypothetical protein
VLRFDFTGLGQRAGDEGRRLGVFGAGEAVREHRPGSGLAIRRIEPAGQQMAEAAGEFHFDAGHVGPFHSTRLT